MQRLSLMGKSTLSFIRKTGFISAKKGKLFRDVSASAETNDRALVDKTIRISFKSIVQLVVKASGSIPAIEPLSKKDRGNDSSNQKNETVDGHTRDADKASTNRSIIWLRRLRSCATGIRSCCSAVGIWGDRSRLF